MKKLILISLLVLVFGGCSSKYTNPQGEKYEKQCKNNDDYSCLWLANAYNKGNGVKEIDNNKAKEFYEKACNLNNADGCFELGNLYERERNSENTKKFYDKSCTLKNNDVCYNLGILYEREQDYSKAKDYYLKACNLNHKSACMNLGILYDDNTKLGKDGSKSELYYGKACGLNDNIACIMLVEFYRNKKDIEKYQFYLKKSCDIGSLSSCKELDPAFAAQEAEKEKQRELEREREKEKLLGISKSCKSENDKINGCQTTISVSELYNNFEFFALKNTNYDYYTVASYSNGKVTKLKAVNKEDEILKNCTPNKIVKKYPCKIDYLPAGKVLKECNIIKNNDQEMIISCIENGKSYTQHLNRLTGQQMTTW